MSEIANYLQVQRALDEQTPSILDQIPAKAVQLFMPLDGQGPRIRASVKTEERAKVPSHVDVELDGREVTIPIETATDFEDFKAY